MSDGQQVQGPDGNMYQFPAGTTKDAAIAYFKKKGIGASVQTAKQPPAVTMRAQPKFPSREWFTRQKLNAEEGLASSMPGLGATAGGIAGFAEGGPIGGVGGAGVGGMGGQAAKQLLYRLFFGEGPKTVGEVAKDITKEGVEQAMIQTVTEGMGAAAPALRRAATSQYERALAPTTKSAKYTTQQIVPELLERKEAGSLKGITERAEQHAADVKLKLDATYAKTPASKTLGSGTQIVNDLEKLKGKYMLKGQPVIPEAVNAITGVQDVVKQFGADIPPDSLRKLKAVFDAPVAAKSGYAGADLATQYTLQAREQAANSIRDLMGKASPDVAALNKEISFWLKVQDVTSATLQRRTGQTGGLVKVLSPLGVGAAATTTGMHFGTTAGIEAGIAASLTTAAVQIMRSPAWRTMSAVAKNQVANALARGDVGEVTALAARFAKAGTEAKPRGTQSGQGATP
jgi:hypothetical protein